MGFHRSGGNAEGAGEGCAPGEGVVPDRPVRRAEFISYSSSRIAASVPRASVAISSNRPSSLLSDRPSWASWTSLDVRCSTASRSRSASRWRSAPAAVRASHGELPRAVSAEKGSPANAPSAAAVTVSAPAVMSGAGQVRAAPRP